MPSMFNARDASNYERLMGRWSRRLAPLFIEHAGIAKGDEVIEVGCGTGSLTFTLPQKAILARLTAIDHSDIYLAAAMAKNRDSRIRFEQGDGCALPFPDARFDRALSMLVLPSVVPQPELMVAEMRRVTRPGGVVAAAFWDSPGGSPSQRMLWDTAAAFDKAAAEARDRTMGRPIYAPGAMAQMWTEVGLIDIDQRSLIYEWTSPISPITGSRSRVARARSAPMSRHSAIAGDVGDDRRIEAFDPLEDDDRAAAGTLEFEDGRGDVEFTPDRFADAH